MSLLILLDRDLPLEDLRPLVTADGNEGTMVVHRLLRRYTKGELHVSGKGGACFVAWQRNAVVGLVVLSRDLKASNPKTGILDGLYVLPAQRRRGVGTALILRAVNHSRAAFPHMHVNDDRVVNAPFWQAMGFQSGVSDAHVTHVRQASSTLPKLPSSS